MSTQYTQSRARGFTPLFRGPYSDQHMRVSDAERQAVADRLAEHFTDGRLDQAEFDERVGQAMSAKTRADLAGLFDDLPETGAPAVAGQAAAGRPRRRPVRSFFILVLFLIVAVAASHAALHLAAAVLWAALLVAVFVIATRVAGRAHRLSSSRSRRD
jgi:Flp pilus assembly protein TadB